VSGDRDFIHVLKTLRRHGKTVIGISPEDAASDDFAALCDRFLCYQALASTYNPQDGADGGKDLAQVARALREILATEPAGLKGATIKPALRRKLGSTFDESEYGYSRLSDLLLAMPDVVRVIPGEGGTDVTVRLVGPAGSAPSSELAARLRHAARLAEYK